MNTKIILNSPPESFSEAVRYSDTVGHLAYQIGEDFRLYRSAIPLSLKGGLMVLGDKNLKNAGDCEILSSEIMRECAQMGFHGVILLFQHSVQILHRLTATLSERLKKHSVELYVNEAYSEDSSWAKVMVSASISGGSLSVRFQELCTKYTPERLCLDIERVRMDFCLPSPDGTGTPLSEEELENLKESYNPQPYFSQELCSYYFTFTDDKGSHFVLYDDAGSIRKKILLASKMGIHSAMLLYPEIKDIIHSL